MSLNIFFLLILLECMFLPPLYPRLLSLILIPIEDGDDALQVGGLVSTLVFAKAKGGQVS